VNASHHRPQPGLQHAVQLQCLARSDAQPHPSVPAKCSRCLKPAPGYDRLEQRSWLFVPLWGIVTWLLYAARRVNCPERGGLLLISSKILKSFRACDFSHFWRVRTASP
jgi:transposase